MIDLNIPSAQVSTALQQALADLGLSVITHYEQSLHIDGTPEQIAEGRRWSRHLTSRRGCLRTERKSTSRPPFNLSSSRLKAQ